MHIEHYEKGLRYTDRELLDIARKLGRLATRCSRLKDESSVIRVEAEKRPTKKKEDETKVMITVILPKKTLYVESRKAKVLEAVNRCVEKLESSLEEYKELHTRKGKVRAARRGRSKE